MNYPKKFEELITFFRHLPGVGEKTAQRYAFHMLGWNEEYIEQAVNAINGLHEGISTCKVCGNLSDGDLCPICMDKSRDVHVICVVQDPKDIVAIESMQEYEGVYHVLHGLINTKKGILPDALNIENLINRVNENTKEVILALDPTIEGETTALYLMKLLENRVKVTRLAYGIAVGSHLDYTDALTLSKAFSGRK